MSSSMSATQISAPVKDHLHLLASLVLLVLFGWVLIREFTGFRVAGAVDGPLQALILLAAVSSLVAHARQLQWQYVLSAAAICGGLGSVAFLTSENAGIPLGPLVFGPAAGTQLTSKLPWTVPCLWIVVVFNSRGVARLMLRPWRKLKTYGYWLIGLTSTLAMLFDLGMDPFLARLNRYWIWQPTKFPLTWAGAPLINFPGWGLVTLFMLAFATPLLIKKQPGQKHHPDYHPLLVWTGALLLFALAEGQHGLWAAVAMNATVIVAVLIPAIRGGRW